MTPKISIVIPTKNEESYLPLLLTSIRNQQGVEYEIIIADALSTDETRRIAESYGARVVDGGMPGPGRNRGAEVATGEYILFLDSDVVLPSPTTLKEMLSEFDERKLDVASCMVKPISTKMIDIALHDAYNQYAILTEQVLPHIQGPCMLVRRSTHLAIHGFDEEVVMAEDHEYGRRAAKNGFAVGYLRTSSILLSVRRLDKEGRVGLLLKYFLFEFLMVVNGPINGDLPVAYEFAAWEKDAKKNKKKKSSTS